MTRRFAAVLATPKPSPATPVGGDAEEFRLALLEDTYEVIAGLDLVDSALAVTASDGSAETVTWPGTPILRLDAAAEPLPAAFAGLAGLGAEQAVVVASDAPDLPPLLIGKLFRALGGGDVAICPAADGGLVAMAVGLPAPPWVSGVDLDTPDAAVRLRAAAERPGAVRSGPGWHRLRVPADLSRLDPGLEGWDATRALLGGTRG